MTDPRENCPWKCKHCLCYEGEIKRLEKNLAAVKLSNTHLNDRYVPCPDHRDKHKTGDECLMCQLERESAENSRLKSQLDEFVYAENNPTYESEAERLQKIIIKAYQHLGFTGQKNNTMRILGTGLPNAKDSERVSTEPGR